jgi:molecular chaperone HscB
MQNYFVLLGLPESFDIHLSELERVYFAKQRDFHPDRQIGKNDAEKQKAIFASMDINTAYQALKDPLKRAQHLLDLQGIWVNSEGKDTVKPTPELLMEMMILREEVSECQNLLAWETLNQHANKQHENVLENI